MAMRTGSMPARAHTVESYGSASSAAAAAAAFSFARASLAAARRASTVFSASSSSASAAFTASASGSPAALRPFVNSSSRASTQLSQFSRMTRPMADHWAAPAPWKWSAPLAVAASTEFDANIRLMGVTSAMAPMERVMPRARSAVETWS